MKFDIHNHILPETWPDLKQARVIKFALSTHIINLVGGFFQRYGYGGFVQLDHASCSEAGKANMMKDGKFFRKVDKNCWSPEERCNRKYWGGGGLFKILIYPAESQTWTETEFQFRPYQLCPSCSATG